MLTTRQEVGGLLRVIDNAYEWALRKSFLPAFLQNLSEYLDAGTIAIAAAGVNGWRLQGSWNGRHFVHPDIAAGGGSLAGPELASVPDRGCFALHAFPEVLRSLAPVLPQAGTGWEGGIAAVLGTVDGERHLLVTLPHADSRCPAKQRAEAFDLILPHLQRAYQLGHRAESTALSLGAAETVVKRFPMPCLLTDTAGRCVERNERAAAVFPQLRLQVHAGRLRFDDPFVQGFWDTALYEASTTAVSRSFQARTQQDGVWTIHLVPLQCHVGQLAGAAQEMLLVVMDNRQAAQAALPESLLALDKLTPAESEVLAGLLQGHTAKVIARNRGASVNTVRNQIMAILAKTGHRSQKELIVAFGASSFNVNSLPYSS